MVAAACCQALLATLLAVAAEHTGRPTIPLAGAAMFGVGALLCLAEALAAALIVVRVSGHTVRARPVLLPLSGITIPVRSIRAAQPILASAQPWAGWGWWWRARPATTVVTRSGPALALQLSSGRQAVISLDQPEHAAWLLSQLANGQEPRT
jgi:hypothetical protein